MSPAGAAGVVATSSGLSQSANGWNWTTVAGTSSDMSIDVFALRGTTAVAAGYRFTADVPGQSLWVGSVAGQ
jgi:hypothetical protein